MNLSQLNLHFRYRKYKDEIYLILTFLSEKSSSRNSILDFVFKHGLDRCYDDLSTKENEKRAKQRVNHALSILVGKKLLELNKNLYQLTELGKNEYNRKEGIKFYDSRLVNVLTNPILSPFLNILFFLFIGYSAFIISSDSDILSLQILVVQSIMLIITIVLTHFVVIFDKVKSGNTIISLFSLFIGLISLFFTLTREKTPISNSEIPVLVFALVGLIVLNINYFYQLLIGLKHKNLVILSLAHRNTLLMGALGLILISSISFSLNYYPATIDFISSLLICLFIAESNVEILNEGHGNLLLISMKKGPQKHDELLTVIPRLSFRIGSTEFLQKHGKNPSREASRQLELLKTEYVLKYYIKKNFIHFDGSKYSLTEIGEQKANRASKGMSYALRITRSITKPEISPILSLLIHLILGILKFLGFFLIGSVSLLGDGIDSLMDAISAIAVGIAIKVEKEIKATYLLLILMLITGFGILIQSIERVFNPIPLQEEELAIIISVISMFICALLYLYQRYSGFKNKSIAILAQSEDSKNHVLNAFLVLTAVLATRLNIHVIDGIIGCFISYIILKGAYELYKDIEAQNQGEEVDYDKYKLFMVKSFNKYQKNVLDLWVLNNVFHGIRSIDALVDLFNIDFSPITMVVDSDQGESQEYVWNAPHSKEQLYETVETMIERKLMDKSNDNLYNLTIKGEKFVRKKLRIY